MVAGFGRHEVVCYVCCEYGASEDEEYVSEAFGLHGEQIYSTILGLLSSFA